MKQAGRLILKGNVEVRERETDGQQTQRDRDRHAINRLKRPTLN